MAVTRSKAVERAEIRQTAGYGFSWRLRELGGLLAVTIAVLVGLMLVYRAKAPELGEAEVGLAAKKLVNLNELTAREELMPALSGITSQADRVNLADKIYKLSGSMPNVGRIRAFMTGDQFRDLKPLSVFI